ncbi:HAD family hydrolase [Natrarchaeobaculum sulfurireducens]|nr:HAD-IA family hydrolase [Natrarchaeobaculum sulfurireducens]
MTTRPTTTTESIIDVAGDHAVLFDMDGVILRGYGTDPEVHSRALHDAVVDLELDVEYEALAALETYEYTDEFAETCIRLGIDPSEFYALREHYSAQRSIERIQAGKRELYPDVTALDTLVEQCPTALVSNNYDPTVSFVVDHFDLRTFSYVRGRDLGVEGFCRRKPDPYYLEEAIDTLEIDGGLYVGDRETDLIAAENAGLLPVLLRRSHNETLEPQFESYLEIESLQELLEYV